MTGTLFLRKAIDVEAVLGYDMSIHVKRYGKYISEKISTYRLCAFDFCKVKRGRDDGLLRTLHTDKVFHLYLKNPNLIFEFSYLKQCQLFNH